MLTSAAYGQQDSVLVQQLSESMVSAVRAQGNAPFAVAEVGRAELQDFSSSGRELPALLSRTPGVLSWSDNGLGTGTSYLRIRGAGDSRINVTIDGVPLNSPEDQCVFWANMNSYSAILGSAQIQRGVGTSTNGDGAFGGTVSLSTKAPSLVPGATLSSSYGSCNTFNAGLSISSGLIRDRLVLEGAYHETSTDGYMHGTAGRSGSYYGSLSWIGEGYIIRYSNIGNYEHTGQAWNGAVTGNDDASLVDAGILSYADMCAHGLGQFNPLYERLVFDDGEWAFPKDADGNYKTERYTMKDGSWWPQTTDNFWQDHNILSVSGVLSDGLRASAALHYTYGYGYYEEFRPQNKLKKFGLVDPVYKKADFVRRKGLEQNTFGLVGSLNYKDSNWDITGGVSLQRFGGNHFGYLTYVSESLTTDMLAEGPYKYYDSDAVKGDWSGYVKALRHLGRGFDAFADLQYRRVDYRTWGVNDKFYKQDDGSYRNQKLDVDKHYDFFNPKAGFSYASKAWKAYASVALSHREPERNNFTDNGSYPAPEAESVLDWEAGWQYGSGRVRVSQNFYYMDYTNQFVQTGAVSDIGEALTTNIRDSYRMGVETSVAVDLLPCLSIEENTAVSRNRILDFNEVVEDWDNPDHPEQWPVVHYDKSTLAYSPSVILNGFVDFHMKGFRAAWHTGYVSRQYLDNTENESRSLPGYTLSDLSLSYTLKFPKYLKEAVFGLNLGNVFNARVAQSGWVYTAVGYGYTLDKRYCQIGYYPAAGVTAMGSLRLTF